MYKLIFQLITNPLGSPISTLLEYIILIVINIVAYRIAWRVSQGGGLGSEIHWVVRILTFILLWATTYFLIFVGEWIYRNWLMVLGMVGGIILIVAGFKIIILPNRQRKMQSKC